MSNGADKRHIGYAILKSGWRYSMEEKLWSVFALNRDWIWTSDLVLGDKVRTMHSSEFDEVVGFSVIEEVMNS